MNAVLDNDVLAKGACYHLLPAIVAAIPPAQELGVLGAARFVVPKAIKRKELVGDKSTILQELEWFLESAQILEPSSDEQKLAAELERAAQNANLSLDVGESQLCAIVVIRFVPFLLTGDKRAIESLEFLINSTVELASLQGKIRCLEQLIVLLIQREGGEKIRTAVCAETKVDKSLSICFSCSSPEIPIATNLEALESYIRSLRTVAPRTLEP